MSKPVEGVQPAFDEDWTVLYAYQNIAGVPEMIKHYERQEVEVLEARDQAMEEHQLKQELERVFPALVVLACRDIERLHPSYLPLPATLVSIEQDRFYYTFARSYGRLCFRMDQYTLNDDGDLVRVPHLATRQDIYDFIDGTIRPGDKRLSVALPLAYRVGVVVGWLSALSIAQSDDAQAGLVILSALVAPLLCPMWSSEVYPTARPNTTPTISRKQSPVVRLPARRRATRRAKK